MSDATTAAPGATDTPTATAGSSDAVPAASPASYHEVFSVQANNGQLPRGYDTYDEAVQAGKDTGADKFSVIREYVRDEAQVNTPATPATPATPDPFVPDPTTAPLPADDEAAEAADEAAEAAAAAASTTTTTPPSIPSSTPESTTPTSESTTPSTPATSGS